jgi:hypothetical protein
MFYFVTMDNMEHPVIGFGLSYGNQLIYCEAVMKDDHYDVLFDGNWVASIAHNDDWDWMQASGVILPEETIVEIGLRIESNYQ